MRGELLLLTSFVNHWLQALDSQLLYAKQQRITTAFFRISVEGGKLSFRFTTVPGIIPWHFLFRMQPKNQIQINYFFNNRKEDAK